MKAMLIEMIVNDTLVNPCCEDSHDDVQIQGAVQNMEEMEFLFRRLEIFLEV